MDLNKVIQSTNGKMFTVCFIKKDGTERIMNCRLGVKKHLKGGASTTSHKKNLVTVYDVKAEGYRNINLDTIKWIKANNQLITN